MKLYKVAILIDPDCAGNVPEILERFEPKYTVKKVVSTTFTTYHVYYWDWCKFYGSKEYTELHFELARVRHSLIEISEDGEFRSDNQNEDEWGCDDEIETVLFWDADITLGSEPLVGISSNRLLNILKTYIDDDENSVCFQNYVVDKLRDICGCTDEELEVLGYGKEA